MSTASDLVQVAVVPEAVYGTTPVTPAFLVTRITGEGLAFAPTTTQSNEMNPHRQTTDSILTGGSSSGDLSFELSFEEWFELLLAGAFAEDWNADKLIIGKTLKSFTVEKKIPVDGVDNYHRFSGCIVDTFNLTISPNSPVTGSFGLIGRTVEPSTAPIVGATYKEANLAPVMVAPRVVGIEIGGVPAVGKCFNSLSISMSNNNRGVECIGTLGTKEMLLGRVDVQAQFSVLFTDNTLLETLLNQTDTSLKFTVEDTATPKNSYTFEIPRVRFSANPIVAGGTGQDVVNSVTASGLLPMTGDKSSLIVTRSARA